MKNFIRINRPTWLLILSNLNLLLICFCLISCKLHFSTNSRKHTKPRLSEILKFLSIKDKKKKPQLFLYVTLPHLIRRIHRPQLFCLKSACTHLHTLRDSLWAQTHSNCLYGLLTVPGFCSHLQVLTLLVIQLTLVLPLHWCFTH